jgi:acylphosphatase
LISGHVQGVGFRYFAEATASREGVLGWVRNLPDGRVEALIQGTREQVDGLIKWCYRGPAEARVSDIAVTPEEAADDLKDFGIR